MNRPPRTSGGFTLIELMIAVAVVAILARIAIPAYSDYVLRTKIAEAVTNLTDMRAKLEQYFQDKRTYVGACAAGTVAPLPSGTLAKYFTYTCPTLTATTFTVRAAGNASTGMGSFIYTIDQNNARVTVSVPSDWVAQTTCWTLKKDGSC